ncbi:MAG: 16S rRNA (cytosine(967)-C(5))-methyltransferase RsmB, partial [Gallionella sp.]
VLGNGRNLNQELHKSLRDNSRWLPQQCAALQDLSYGTLRHFGQLQTILDHLLDKPLQDELVRCLLLVALYQLQHGKSAKYAVVDHAVRAAQILNRRAAGLVNAVLRNFLRKQQELAALADASPEGKYSYPRWWFDELSVQYGDLAPDILAQGNLHPPMTLRINRRLGTPSDYLKLLAQVNLSASMIAPDALQLAKPVGVDKLPGFLEGRVSVQDAGAQYAATILDVHDGMRVLDACAAPGGKTAHMLELANLEMVSLDIDEARMQRVADNLRRLGLVATLTIGNAAEARGWWDGRTFQRILADVPCSASGVVRRHPDIKWLRRRSDIAGFASQQLAILRSLWRLLEANGKLLYATCSIFRQENEQVVSSFLAENQDARRLPVDLPDSSQGQLLPNEQHDGFFYALLQKTA